MAGTRVEAVLGALKGAFESKGWHGPTVLEAIRGVTEAQACRKPGGAHHSIHQLVEHIEYWEAMGLHYVRTGAPGRLERHEWSPPTTTLAASVRRLRSSHKALVAAVARLKDGGLDRNVRTTSAGSRTLVDVLLGIAAHDAYHAGQIRLIRTLLPRR